MQCALCRVKYCLSEKVIKTVMAKHVPSHAIVLENKCCDKKYVLTHQPCEHGCYVCEEAEQVRHLLVRREARVHPRRTEPADVEEQLADVSLVARHLVAAQLDLREATAADPSHKAAAASLLRVTEALKEQMASSASGER